MATRADRIYSILEKEESGRLSVSILAKKLAEEEKSEGIDSVLVSSTVRQDNRSRINRGLAPRFNCFGKDGDEEHGFISVRKTKRTTSVVNIVDNAEEQIPLFIEQANAKIKDDVKQAIGQLSWQEFESNFLMDILEALGFRDIKLTKSTRDGGIDAYCTYKVGIIENQAVISAKKWGGQKVSSSEVRDLRGATRDAARIDTGIIFSTSGFTDDAKEEAKPVQGYRSIVLVDLDLIIETCFSSLIGVKEIKLPTLYEFAGFKDQE